MGFNSAFKGLKLFKKPGNGRLNNLNNLSDPSRPQCVNKYVISNGSECLGSLLSVKPCGVKHKTNTTTVIWSLLCLLLFRSKVFILFSYAECREGVWGIGGAVLFILEVRIIGRYAL